VTRSAFVEASTFAEATARQDGATGVEVKTDSVQSNCRTLRSPEESKKEEVGNQKSEARNQKSDKRHSSGALKCAELARATLAIFFEFFHSNGFNSPSMNEVRSKN